MLLSWGSYIFSADAASFDEIELSSEYPWNKVDRIGNTPQLQAMGLEHRKIILRGVIFPTYQNATGPIDVLRMLAGEMEPKSLISGDGRNRGQWCVTRIGETDSYLLPNGSPRKQIYTMEMERYDE